MEILAPAGNAAALHAAVSAGADAVYLGLESFNARRGADNFTLDTLGDACAYAHLRGVHVYVTMNTVILPGEVDEALECARQAWRAGADAFIVQDIGLAAELVRTLPQAPLHISTQMNIHDAAGIRAAARLGARRVTLARELSLGEIEHLAALAAELGMEVETFGHGALCVCYSGQCLMSSLIGGRSANRGMCAQACRLPYKLKNRAMRSKELPSPGDHLLSPQDLCAIDLVGELACAGVASLKIEGRMKSPEYVQSVVKVYRSLVDRVAAARSEDGAVDVRRVHAAEQEHDDLASVFSRGFTTAYLEGERGNEIMSYRRPNNRGQFVGRVSAVEDGFATIAAERRLVPGDVIEFWTKRGHAALPLARVDEPRRGFARVALDQKTRNVRPGDRVFRVRSAEAAFADDVHEPRIPVVGSVVMRIGAPLYMDFRPAKPEDASLLENAGLPPADLAVAEATASRLARSRLVEAIGCAQGAVVESARTKAVAEEDVRDHVDRMGATPFCLVDLHVELDEGVGIGFSQIHRCRAEALELLEAALLEGTRSRALPKVAARSDALVRPSERAEVVALATNPVCARAARKAGAVAVYVPALNLRRGEHLIAGQLMGEESQATYPKDCIAVMPTVCHDARGRSREAQVDFDVWGLVRAGEPVVVDSLSGLLRAGETEASRIEVGPHLPVANHLALSAVRAMGALRVWLSPELTLRQISELARESSVGLGITVIGNQELMVTEHCLLMSQGDCAQECAVCPRRKSPHHLMDRKDYEFPVVTDLFGRSHLYNGVTLDIVPALPELLAAGVATFMVDTTLMNGDQAAEAVERAVRGLKCALRDGGKLAKAPDATSGHLYRGVL